MQRRRPKICVNHTNWPFRSGGQDLSSTGTDRGPSGFALKTAEESHPGGILICARKNALNQLDFFFTSDPIHIGSQMIVARLQSSSPAARCRPDPVDPPERRSGVCEVPPRSLFLQSRK